MRRFAFWRRCTCVRLLSAPGLMTRYVSPDCPRHSHGCNCDHYREALERITEPTGIMTVDDLWEIANDALRKGS